MVRLGPGHFYGERVRHCAVGGFFLAESVYAPNHRIPAHVHESAFFYLVLGGSSTETSHRRTTTCASSSLVFHPVGEAHANHWHEGGGRCLHIEVSADRLAQMEQHARLLSHAAEFHGGRATWLAHRVSEESRVMDAAAPLAVEGLILELLAEVARHPVPLEDRRPPRWLHHVRELLRARFAESLSLDEIAAAAGVHPAHLARSFRRHERCTVGDYQRQLRVECACRLLVTSDQPLIEIAIEAGFVDQSHFTRTFKRQMGMTPGEFRAQHRRRNSDARK
jgi:AraC family transcriptional regulator